MQVTSLYNQLVINPVMVASLPGLRLTSQLQGVTAPWSVCFVIVIEADV